MYEKKWTGMRILQIFILSIAEMSCCRTFLKIGPEVDMSGYKG